MTAAARAMLAVLIGAAALGCATQPAITPPAGSLPGQVGDAVGVTRQLIVNALGAVGLQAVDSTRPYRPQEADLLRGAARSVLQATLPDDPNGGYIVIYSLLTSEAAQRAATGQAAYIASGPGGIQFPTGSHFVLRVVDSTVVFFTWAPGSAPDPRTPLIEDALQNVGVEVPIRA